MKQNIYISNNCTNLHFYFTQNMEYNHPFISCMFIDDAQYVKFCKNFSYYISQIPKWGEPSKNSILVSVK